MRTRIQKWGNSLAVRIPADLAREAEIGEGTAVEVELDAGTLRIARSAPIPTLAELLASVDPSDLHGETDWGPRQGREEW